MTGVPVATRYTLEFVLRCLPQDARDVLEIGCGAGELALALEEAGISVLAIDSGTEAVAAARNAGVDALMIEWPAELDRKFDAVLFTRSLHHIHDLVGAVGAACRVLRPDGRVIVEDFRSEGGSARSTAWFTGLAKVLHAAHAFDAEFDLEQTLAKTETVDHEHPLHSSIAIGDALARFGPVEAEDSAYYFRYLEAELQFSNAARRLLDHELEMIDAGAIDSLGKRFVLAPPS